MRSRYIKGDRKAVTTSTVDFQIALENPQGRAYYDYVNGVTLTMSTQL